MKTFIDSKNFDLSKKPCDDFNLYCNGNWMKKNKIPDDRSRWGTFDELDELNIKQMLDMIADIKKNADDDNEKKIINFWNSGMDLKNIEKDGIKNLLPILNLVADLNKKEDISKLIGYLHNYGINIFFAIIAAQDAKKSDFVIPHIYSSGLNLPDREFYLNPDKEKIVKRYKKFLIDLLKNLKNIINKNDSIPELVNNIVNLETDIAKNRLPRDEMRDPEKLYNKLTLKEINELNTLFDWDIYFSNANLPINKFIILDQPKIARNLDKIIKKYDLSTIKCYIFTRIMIGLLPFLTNKLDSLHFDFFGKVISGQVERKPRKKRMVNWINASLGEVMGKKYVEKFFPEKSKKKALELVNDIISIFRDRLKNLEWMEESTKKKAIKKLDNLNVKIGYPDKWLDYSALTIIPDSFIINILNSNQFDWNFELSKMNKPVNRNLWEMLPQQINAYFHPEMNEIVFPAAILQYPFFSEDFDDAINYGGIGAVIGHEITHGFDDQGRKYNYKGNLEEWWSKNDKTDFNKRAKKIIEQFDNSIVLKKHVNGKLTQGENIADLGGLKIAYYALNKKLLRNNLNINEMFIDSINNKFTIKQRFFISWAQIWKMNIRDEKQLEMLITDPHSPNECRINEPLKNMEEFFDAFDIKEGDKMRRDKKDLIKIW